MNSIQHSNGRGSPPIGAYGCGCDGPDIHIHEWEANAVVVRASYCAACGRVISFQIQTFKGGMIDRNITPELGGL